jgi:hypothetical protein
MRQAYPVLFTYGILFVVWRMNCVQLLDTCITLPAHLCNFTKIKQLLYFLHTQFNYCFLWTNRVVYFVPLEACEQVACSVTAVTDRYLRVGLVRLLSRDFIMVL